MYEEVRLPATRTDYPLQNHVPSRLALGGGHEDDQLRPREAWNVILRNRTVIFFCFGLVILFAVVFTRMVTPIYQAQTSIQIDDKPGAVQGITLSPGGGGANQLGTEVEVLRSRTLAEDVAETDSGEESEGAAAPPVPEPARSEVGSVMVARLPAHDDGHGAVDQGVASGSRPLPKLLRWRPTPWPRWISA